jgi:hypothetical protein
MKSRALLPALSACFAAVALVAQQPYSGPRPPIKDIPYLIEASRLVETEVHQQPPSKTKEGQSFTVPGAASPARTPIPEPAFLFSPDHLRADQLVLRRLETKNGQRELAPTGSADAASNYHLTLRRLAPDLYRIEVDEMLDAGEYALLPQGESTIFCFAVY